ncbi:endo-1,4-beta-xylanase [Echria macrotheca]|uniref:endo-1,4-beta-xylanase n=1 Tax=Echria macrotheca TaxID=438768 RepID=A0AAJ0F945_9PEZI|nr:endo-1,4-beta-xylanase [Echria macrotheca]
MVLSGICITISPCQSLILSPTTIGTGSHGGFFYSFWTDGVGDSNCSNFFGGKGWNPSKVERNVTYSGTFSPEGNRYLSVYSMTKNPLVEYYTDGGSYPLGTKRIVRVAIGSESILAQVWSVRDVSDRRVAGYELGNQDFQIVAAEGYQSGGEAEITVEMNE